MYVSIKECTRVQLVWICIHCTCKHHAYFYVAFNRTSQSRLVDPSTIGDTLASFIGRIRLSLKQSYFYKCTWPIIVTRLFNTRATIFWTITLIGD